MAEEIRSFIAIEISHILRDNIRKLLIIMMKTGADVRWVRPEGIHLTLKFLGAVKRETLEMVAKAVQPIVEAYEPFEIRVRALGCFPSIRNPRVVWVGLDAEEETLLSLQKGIEKKSAELGFPLEGRPFTPHLTLGRVRSPKGKSALIQEIERNSGIDLGSMRVEKVFLFKSDLRPEGAVYTKMYEFAMKKNGRP